MSLFFGKTITTPKRVVDFPWERDTFRNKIMEIVEDFDEKSYNNNNGKPWKSSSILRVNPNFFIFLFVNIFLQFSFFSFFRFFFIFFIFSFFLFHFSICFIFFIFFHFSFIFLHVPSCFLHFPSVFLHFLSFSFIFFHFRSFSFIFVHFLSFSFIFIHFHFLSFSLSWLGAQNLIFFGPQFRYDFS